MFSHTATMHIDVAFPQFSERWKKWSKYAILCNSVLLQNVRIHFSYM